MFTGGARLRPGARPHLQRDGGRSAQHAQVPGHVAAAAAAGERAGSCPARAPTGCATPCCPTAWIAPRRSSFDGIDTQPHDRWLAYAGANPPAALTRALARSPVTSAARARARRRRRSAATVAPLAAGLTAVRALRVAAGRHGPPDEAQFEIDFRLAQKEAQFVEALVLAADMRLDAVADDGAGRRRAAGGRRSARGQPRRRGDVAATVEQASTPRHAVHGRRSIAARRVSCAAAARIPADAR